ncbi:MAG: glycerol-3-phosphate 1-O-acyltransferase PlsY [Anaerolineae bacterium]|jgi:acyl phosphate:glycerol-3-phosphate acyltransferase|nr:glycerol-3-phosphate 1-O-acyltransferase PlsY [Anaerolineae bacterium]MBT7075568.1 glycerol-3-phosphate 1-O-acyltransferase PlsY [Anaerolineae bacterium]MBT7782279.1 glycerol-3-phosphate 1-O-acyltransferase PlsY [Anaerolineae bacterium]
MTFETIIAILLGYAFGCIQPSYFLSKTIRKTDIREHGSGNAGASNTTAIMGWKYGIIVALIDILKGFFALSLIKWIYPDSPNLAYLAGIMAIVGHIFPFYMRFQGGKGLATLIGMAFGINWKLGMIFGSLVIFPALITDYIVAGSFSAFIALPIATYLLEYPIFLVGIATLLLGLIVYLHRANIQRIFKKEELKVSTVIKRR